MSPALKKGLVISAKHAVLALFTNSAMAAVFPKDFHLHDWRGTAHIVVLTAVQIVGRELVQLWLPKLLVWASSNSNGGTNVQNTSNTQPSNPVPGK